MRQLVCLKKSPKEISNYAIRKHLASDCRLSTTVSQFHRRLLPSSLTHRYLKQFADFIFTLILIVAVLSPILLHGTQHFGKRNWLIVVELDQSFYKTVLYPDLLQTRDQGPNSEKVK